MFVHVLYIVAFTLEGCAMLSTPPVEVVSTLESCAMLSTPHVEVVSHAMIVTFPIYSSAHTRGVCHAEYAPCRRGQSRYI